MRKENISQVDFSLGAVRKEAIERDDTSLIVQSTQEAQNTIGLTPGSMESRPGSVELNTTLANKGVEVDLGAGRVFDLHIVPTGVILYDSAGAVEASFATVTWVNITKKFGTPVFDTVQFWVVADPDSSSILIGARNFPIHALVVDDAGVWSFGEMSFATSLGGAALQPYWNYYRGTTIQPSAVTGSITVTASDPIWTASHNGMRIRYLDREIVLGTTVSTTVINATVTQELPPTYDLTVGAASGYALGEAVEHSVLGGQGVITGISGSIITVLATLLWDGFTNSGKLVAPNASQTISVKATVSPAATHLWDMQMQSPIHGYAGWAAKHKGRAYLNDFPGAPQGFAVSVAGFIDDFTMGANDGDGFVDSIGANDGGDLKYIVSAEDLLFFTTKGLYYQQTRDGSAITPLTIGPVRFSKMGCASISPVAVDDGAIFVDAAGKQIYAAILSGDIYRSWTALNISKFHSHLIGTPTFIGATASGSETPEQFIYVVGSGGECAVGQWDRAANKVGWRPWVTDGSYKAIYQVFGKTHAVVQRTINSVVTTFREQFVTGIFMDCVASLKVSISFPAGEVGATYFGGVTKAATHLNGHTATVYFEGWDLGDRSINASGAPLDDASALIIYPVYAGVLQIGLKFTVKVVPWPRRSINTQRGIRDVKRTTKMMFTVQDTLAFAFDGQGFGGYRAGEDLSLPPLMRSQEVSFITGGREFFENRALVVDRPGPFRLLKIKYRVTI